ncbi:MAG: nucleotidyltransferase family protein [Chloroflexota bacterium]
MSTYPFNADKLVDICRAHDVTMLGIFGSMSRGEATAESDIDVLVRFGKRKSLLALVRLERELSTALGRKVDLLTEAALSPYLRKRILDELRIIYEQG